MNYNAKITDLLFTELEEFVQKTISVSKLGYHSANHSKVLSKILSDTPVWIYCEDSNGDIVGVFSLRKKVGSFGTVYNSMPFFGANAGVIVKDDENQNQIISVLMDEFKSLISNKETLSAAFYSPFLGDQEFYKEVIQPDEILEKSALYLDLLGIEKWPISRRGDIKKAMKSGVTIRPTKIEDIEILYDLYKSDCEWKGIPIKPISYFEDTLQFSQEDSSKDFLWITAELEGKVVGGLLCVCAQEVGSYTIPVADVKYRNLQPIALMIDNAIKILKDRGVRYFNFEASPEINGAVYLYKKRWGAIDFDYSILLSYPNGKEKFTNISKDELMKEYPNYFVTPFR